ncbi:hypothetical protein [Kitasatospora cineracea]|uniref:Helix-turn-helix protein n=1 Tax=Kitasatospora cineracea TaxID=88074 RepID=A0A3N4R9P1_9ACTN|nr:hypothetical protein [Kitasatospora cineracea]RPE27321.1 hypothetical protein EDD38_7466 [Kitasatospora cineracea]
MSLESVSEDEIVAVDWPTYYTQVPVWLLLAPISAQAYRMYAFLAEHINNRQPGRRISCPKQTSIAQVLRLKNPRQVARYATELQAVGAIRVEEYRYAGGMRRGYRYHVRFNPPAGHDGPVALSQFYAEAKDSGAAAPRGRVAAALDKTAFQPGGTENSTSGGAAESTTGGALSSTAKRDQEERDQQERHGAPSARSAPDARRASTGSSGREAGGSAASGKTKPGLTNAQWALVREVLGLLPDGLRDVPELTTPPRKVQDAVLEALAVGGPWERTPEQLVEFRVLPRWDRHWASILFARDLARPVGPLVAMLKRDPRCNDPRCDEHVEVDTGRPCRVCASLRQDARAQRAPRPSGREAEEQGPAAGSAGVEPVAPLVAEAAMLPGQRGAGQERVPVPSWTRGIGDGDCPNEEYRRQREAMRLRRAGA